MTTVDALELRLNKLRNELNIWQVRINSLKSEEEKISRKIKSLIQQQDVFERDIQDFKDKKFSEIRRGIQKMKIECYIIGENRKSNKCAMEGELREKMNLLQKLDAPLELSPLVQAARGNEVDGEALRGAMIKAIELMISRLDPEHHGMSIEALEQALTSLKSELVIF